MNQSNGDGRSAGTGFYDQRKAFRGAATLVSRRVRALSDLVVLDVVGADPSLALFLSHLDRTPLVVRESDGAAMFVFRWASGYVNGPDIRVQGLLDHS